MAKVSGDIKHFATCVFMMEQIIAELLNPNQSVDRRQQYSGAQKNN